VRHINKPLVALRVNVAFEPILLKNSFLTPDHNFAGP
jgi:hypothetical protein